MRSPALVMVPARKSATSAQCAQHSASAPLEARSLRLVLGGRRVVDDVSVTLAAGQWVAVVGLNGAGKSSLLSLLAGLRRPDSGEVFLEGRSLVQWRVAERARRLAWLDQQGEADGDIAARDVVRLGRLPHHGLLGSPGPADESLVNAAMLETECVALGQRRLNELSGGERQRVLLARALAVQAPVLLLDEPTTHLDIPHQRALLRSVARRAREGAAVAVVMHDLTLALAADRVWLMHEGRLLLNAEPGNPALHKALVSVFEGAMCIEHLEREGRTHFIVRPLL